MALTTYQRRRSEGLCPRCGGEPSEGRVVCRPCGEEDRVRASRCVGTYQRRRSSGLCPLCGGEPREPSVYCSPCAELNRQNSARHYVNRRERIAEGRRERYANDPGYREKQMARARSAGHRSRARLKSDVFAAYGGRCSCCGYADERALELDHVGGGGRRLGHHRAPYASFRDAVRDNYPARYRLLCRNCNWGAHLGEGTCLLSH